MRLVYGKDDFVAQWVAFQMALPNASFFAPYSAIGIEENGFIRGGVVYNNYHLDYNGQPLTIEISGVAIDKRCALRHIIYSLFAYPFIQLRVKRVSFSIAKPNMVARRFAERLGFTLEGVARKAHFSGKDAAIYSMLRHECEWLNAKRAVSSASTRSHHRSQRANSQQSANRSL